MKFKFIASVLFATLFCFAANAQKVGVKTNLLYDATATFNVGAEFALSPKFTVDLSGNLNPWTFSDNTKWKHWLLQPELRYWFCQKFNRSFLAAHTLGGQYNVGNINLGSLKEFRYQGWFVGAGLGYGYSWILSRHWNIEAELGVGVIYTNYDKFYCVRCGEKLETGKDKVFVSPTKASLSLIYLF